MAKTPLGCKNNRKLLLGAIFIVFLLLLTQPAFASYGGGGGGGGGGGDSGGGVVTPPPVTDPDPPPVTPEPEPEEPLEKYTVTVETNVEAKVYMDGGYECETSRSLLCSIIDFFSDCDYSCEIDGVEKGSHTFKAKADNYKDESDSEYISGDETVSLELDEIVQNADPVEIDDIEAPSSVEQGRTFTVSTEVDNVYYKWTSSGYSAKIKVETTFNGETKTTTVTDSCDAIGVCHLYGLFKWLGSLVMGQDIVVDQAFTADDLGTYTISVKVTDLKSDTTDTGTKTIKVIKPRHDVTFETNTKAEIYADGDYLCTTSRPFLIFWGDYYCEAEVSEGTYDFVAEPVSNEFESAERSKTITSDTTVSFTLPLKTFDILVLSNVEGARVYLDNSYQGNTEAMTPSFIIEDLLPDCYKVRVDKIGYIEEPAEEVCLTSSNKQVQIYLYKIPVITVSGESLKQSYGGDFNIGIKDAKGYTYTYTAYHKKSGHVIESGGPYSISSDSYSKDVTVYALSTDPHGDYIFKVELDGHTEMVKEYSFEVFNIKPEIDLNIIAKYTSCELTEDSFNCEEVEDRNPSVIYGKSDLEFIYEIENVVHQCNQYDNCFSYNRKQYDAKVTLDYPTAPFINWVSYSGTTPMGTIYEPGVEKHVDADAEGTGITVTVKDYMDGDETVKTFSNYRFVPNPDPSISNIGLCYIMPDDEGRCDEPIRVGYQDMGYTGGDACEEWRRDHPGFVCPSGTWFNLDPIQKTRTVALYFKVGDLHKFGQSIGYVQLKIDDKPASLLGQGEDLVSGILINETEDVDKPLIWLFNVSTGGRHILKISVTDMQDADNTEETMTLYIEDSFPGQVHTPFEYASGDLKEAYPYIVELQGLIDSLIEDLEGMEEGSLEYNETLETLAFAKILYGMSNTREAIVMTGGSFEAVGSWLEQIGGAFAAFGRWLADVPGHIYNALATFAADPLGTLASIGQWIVDNPWEALEIAISIAAIALLCLTLVGAIGGAIALAGFLIMDVLTIGIIAHKALVLGQPLDTMDYVTIALVIGGNAGVALRAVKPVVKNARLQAIIDRTIRIAELDALSNTFSKMKNRLGSMFGKLRGIPEADIKAMSGRIESVGNRAFGSVWKEKLAGIFTKIGNLRFIDGVSDDLAETMLKLADDLDAATFQKILARSNIEGYLDDMLRAKNVLGNEAVGELADMHWAVKGLNTLTDDQIRSSYNFIKNKAGIIKEVDNIYPIKFKGIKFFNENTDTLMYVSRSDPDVLHINVMKIDAMEELEYVKYLVHHEQGHITHLSPLGWPRSDSTGMIISLQSGGNEFVRIPQVDVNAINPRKFRIYEEIVADKISFIEAANKAAYKAGWNTFFTREVTPHLTSLSADELAYHLTIANKLGNTEVARMVTNEISRQGIVGVENTVREFGDFFNGVVSLW